MRSGITITRASNGPGYSAPLIKDPFIQRPVRTTPKIHLVRLWKIASTGPIIAVTFGPGVAREPTELTEDFGASMLLRIPGNSSMAILPETRRPIGEPREFLRQPIILRQGSGESDGDPPKIFTWISDRVQKYFLTSGNIIPTNLQLHLHSALTIAPQHLQTKALPTAETSSLTSGISVTGAQVLLQILSTAIARSELSPFN